MTKSSIETAGTRYKAAERALRTTLPTRSIIGMRLDGKAFHTFTRQFERPYDHVFMDAMDTAATALVENLSGTMFGYVQSDEISVFFSDMFGESKNKEMPFGGKVEKLLSTSASLLTGAFLKALPDVEGIPVFDARMFVLDDLDDLHNYVDWRRLDARKNAISMAASSLFSHSELHGITTRQRHDLLVGTEHEVLPGGFFEGRLIVRETEKGTTTFTDRSGERTIEVERNVWRAVQATRERTTAEVDRFRS